MGVPAEIAVGLFASIFFWKKMPKKRFSLQSLTQVYIPILIFYFTINGILAVAA